MAMGPADRNLLRVAWATIALSAILVATFGYGRDQGIYAVVARTILEGGMPYRDVFDFKPPGIFIVYAFARALFGSWQQGVRVVEVVGLLATIAGLVTLAERWWGERAIGWLAGAMAALVHAQLDFWHTAQPETFGGMLTIAALVAGGRDAPRRRHLVVTGVLFGLAGLFKPPLAGGGVVFAIWAAPHQRAPHGPEPSGRFARARALLGVAPWVLLGGALPFAAVLTWFAATGALDALYQTLFVFTPHYTQLGHEGRSLVGLLAEAVKHWSIGYSSLLTAGLALAIAHWRSTLERAATGLLGGLIAVQLVGVALQAKFFAYHYAGLWPITSLLAALGWWELWAWARRRGASTVVAVACAAAVVAVLRTATKDLPESFWRRSVRRLALVVGPHDHATADALASVADVSAARNRAVAEVLTRRVPEGHPIFIWGFEPVIYDLADRPSASGFVYNVPQRVPWAAEASRRELMEHLRRVPPAAIVVAAHDVLPMVTGNGSDSRAVLESFESLRSFIRAGFGEPERVHDFEIYFRRRARGTSHHVAPSPERGAHEERARTQAAAAGEASLGETGR